MKKIVVNITAAGKSWGDMFEFDWATHDCTANEKLLSVKEGDNTVLIVPLERLNYLRVVDVPIEEEPDETH